MKTTLLRLSRRAACLVLAGGLLTSCSLLPAASPRHEGTASSQAPQYYSDAWLSDDALHYLYSYAGNGGGTILRGGRVLYKASSSDSIQLLEDTLTGETGHYLVAHSTPGTEERTSTLYDADGNAVMTFPYAVSATLSGGLLILRDERRRLGLRERHHRRHSGVRPRHRRPASRTRNSARLSRGGRGRPAPRLQLLRPARGPYLRLRRPRPAAPPVCPHHRPGGQCADAGGRLHGQLPRIVSRRFCRLARFELVPRLDWGIAREALYNVTTGELLTGEEDSAVSACGVGVACLQSRQDSRSVLYDLNSGEAVELGRFDWCVMDYTPGCVTLLGSDDPDNPYTLIDLASGERPPSSGATRTTTPVMSLC